MDIAVIGVDGLDPDLLRQWREDLPTFDRLIDAGQVGRLRSSDPPLTAPAWSSFATGKQGGKHGIFGFTTRREGGYARRPVTHNDLKAETLWEALDVEGVRCGVVNVPLTYPPPTLDNGFVVAGWPVPNKAEPSRPPKVRKAIEAELGESYEVNPFPLTIEFDQLPKERLYDEISAGLWHHTRAFCVLLDWYEIDVFVGVLMALDIASHNFAWEREFLHEMYVEVDEAVGELLDALPDDTDVVLVSDHGHGAQGPLSFHVNEWLARKGYLTRQQDRSRSLLGALGVTQENYVRVKNLLGFDAPHNRLPESLYTLLANVVPRNRNAEPGFDPGRIDWQSTTVFSAEQNQIFVNGPGYTQPAVGSEDVESVRRKVANTLRAIPHPDGDSPARLMSAVRTREELFDGPHLDRAPDVVFVADEMRCNAPMGFANGAVFTDERWGEHRQYGVFLTAGPSFVAGDDDMARDITDVFPLVLAIAGVGIPENVDGDIPNERLYSSAEPKFRESRDDASSAGAYSDAEAGDIEEQLKGLGYLE